jgi:hypothetical protein
VLVEMACEHFFLIIFMQEDLTVKDTEEILEDLKNDRVPKAGPRYVVRLSLCKFVLTNLN